MLEIQVRHALVEEILFYLIKIPATSIFSVLTEWPTITKRISTETAQIKVKQSTASFVL